MNIYRIEYRTDRTDFNSIRTEYILAESMKSAISAAWKVAPSNATGVGVELRQTNARVVRSRRR